MSNDLSLTYYSFQLREPKSKLSFHSFFLMSFFLSQTMCTLFVLKQRKCHSLINFACILNIQKARFPLKLKNKDTSFSDISDPRKIEQATAFLSRLVAITLCLEQIAIQMNCSPVSVHLYCKSWRQPRLSRGLESKLILTNDIPAI